MPKERAAPGTFTKFDFDRGRESLHRANPEGCRMCRCEPDVEALDFAETTQYT